MLNDLVVWTNQINLTLFVFFKCIRFFSANNETLKCQIHISRLQTKTNYLN